MATTSSGRSSNTSFGARRNAAGSGFCGGAALGIGRGGGGVGTGGGGGPRGWGRGGGVIGPGRASSCEPAVAAGVEGARVFLSGTGGASCLGAVGAGFCSG